MAEKTESTENFDTNQNITVQQKRSGCLTAFLVVMIIANLLVAFYNFYASETILKNRPGMSSWSIYVLGVFGILNTIFAIAIWQWKKIGVYGFIGSAIIIFAINLSIGVNIFAALFGLMGPVILIILLKPVWSYLK